MGEKKRPGRPPSPPGEARSRRLVTFVNDAEYRQIRLFAEEGQLSVSRACYHLIRASLSAVRESEPADVAPQDPTEPGDQ